MPVLHVRLVWCSRHFLLSIWSKTPGCAAKTKLFNNLRIHSTITGVRHNQTLHERRSRIQHQCGYKTNHGVDSASNVVFVSIGDCSDNAFECDATPAEIYFIIYKAVQSCHMNTLCPFVVRLIIEFSLSWCVQLKTKQHEHGTKDVALRLRSPLCRALLKVAYISPPSRCRILSRLS